MSRDFLIPSRTNTSKEDNFEAGPTVKKLKTMSLRGRERSTSEDKQY